MADISQDNIILGLDEDDLNVLEELVEHLDVATRILINKVPLGISEEDYTKTDELANKYRRILTTVHTLEFYEREY